jgi:hypothetical protein
LFKKTNAQLGELKVIGQCATYYNPRTVVKRCGGVEARARGIQSLYEFKARKADIAYNDCDPHSTAKGPMAVRLAEFGKIKSLVMGTRGEASKDLLQLIGEMADVSGERCWREIGARSPKDARKYMLGVLRRKIGIASVTANATLKRERLGIALGDGKAAADRREGHAWNMRHLREGYFAQFGYG